MKITKYNYLDNTEHLEFKQKYIKLFNFKKKNILDIGYSGDTLEILRQNNKISVLDYNKNTLKKAQKKYNIYNIDLNCCNSFLNNKKFDVILMFDVLEHIVRPEDIFSELVKKLNKNGYIFIAVPNSMNIMNRLNFLFGNPTDISDTAHIKKDLFSDHLHLISKKKMIKLYEKYGLRIEIMENYSPKKVSRHKKLSFLNPILFIFEILKLKDIFPGLFASGFIIIGKKK